jgi:hypothetical protein
MKILRGWIGEKKSAASMWLSLGAKTYKRFHDIIIPTANGTTQIDHILVSPFGLFIIETKNRTGWIFGSENQANWTQSLYGKNYSFQNPLRQVFRQKKSLAEFLEVEEASIHTVVYFVGKCRFKTPLPSNVLRSGLGRYVKRFRSQVFSAPEIDRVVQRLTRHRADSKLTKRDHLRSLNERHRSTTKCPKCGRKLVPRTVRNGPTTGTSFLGCEGYPACRFTKDA